MLKYGGILIFLMSKKLSKHWATEILKATVLKTQDGLKLSSASFLYTHKCLRTSETQLH